MPKILTALDIPQIATPSSPASGSNRLYFKSDGNLYALSSAGVETQVESAPFNFSQSFVIQGTAVNSATTPVPWMYAPPLATGQTCTLQEVIYSTASGTCTVAVNKQAFGAPSSFAAVTGLSALAVTSTPQHTPATTPPAVGSRDMLQIVITSAATPVGLTVTLVFEVTP